MLTGNEELTGAGNGNVEKTKDVIFRSQQTGNSMKKRAGKECEPNNEPASY